MLKKILDFILQLLMPIDPKAKMLLSIDAETFTKKAEKSFDKNDEISSVFNYKDPLVKELVRQIKFKNNKKTVSLASDLLYDSIMGFMQDTGYFSGFEKPLLVPVPISKERERERGYNQSALIAREIMASDGGTSLELSEKVVAKIKDTAPQTSLNRAARKKNLLGCFTVLKPEKIKGRNIMVIDDVYTTGSTIKEIRKILLRAGAKKVIGFTLAH